MQTKDGLSSNNLQQPNGICHKLYNFIVNTLFSAPHKRVTMGQTPNSNTDHEILLQDVSRKEEESDVNSSEIVVEFKHTEDWTTAVDKFNATILSDDEKKEKDQIARIGIMKPQFQGTSAGEFEATSTNGIKGKLPKKTVTIKDDQKDHRDKQQQQQQQQQDKNIPTTVEPESVRKPKPPRLLSLTSNINEKSDAFIRSRLEAMRRNFSLETKRS